MIDLKINAKEFGLALKRAPAAIFNGAKQGVKLTHQAFFAEMKKLHRGGGDEKAGPTLRPQIVRTIGQEVTGSDINSLRSVSFTAHIAARIQEHGGTITANGRYSVCGKGKMLAIPLGNQKTKAGFARRGPCDVPNLEILRGAGGKPVLTRTGGFLLGLFAAKKPKAGERRKFTPMFVLKRSVNIKPGLRFFETFTRVVRERLAELVGGRIFAAMQRVFAKGGA